MLQNMRPPFWIERVLSRSEEPAQGEMSAGRHFTESTRLLSTALTAASPVVRTSRAPIPTRRNYVSSPKRILAVAGSAVLAGGATFAAIGLASPPASPSLTSVPA